MDLLASFIPVLLALSLLAFGDARDLDPTLLRRRAVLVVTGAVILGPMIQAQIGFLDWAVLVALSAAGLTIWAAIRHEVQHRAPHGDRLIPR